jgi:hypothetical protein
MITKQEYIEALSFEFTVIKHLAAKVTPDMLEFRPTPKQRSTLELMTFLCTIFGTATEVTKQADSTAAESWNQAVAEKWNATLPKVTVENFGELMDAQAAYIQETVGGMTEEELNTPVVIYGRKQTRAMHLLNGPFKWAPAYKMQLFMYLKMNGQTHLNTMNLWAGMDPVQN